MDHPQQAGYYQMPNVMHPLQFNPNQPNVLPMQNYYLFNTNQPIYNIAHHPPPPSSFMQQVQKNEIVTQPYHQSQKFMPNVPEVPVPNQRKYRIPIFDPVTRKEIDVSSISQPLSIPVPSAQNISKSNTTKLSNIRILPRPNPKPVKSKEMPINFELNNNEVSSTIAFVDGQEAINPSQEIINSSQETELHPELKTPPITPLATNSLIFTPPPCVNKTCVVRPSPRKFVDAENIISDASPSVTSPTDISTSASSRTDTSPSAISPTDTSPSAISPTDISTRAISPTDTSPSATSPTDTSPVNTSPEVNFANNSETPFETVSKSTTTELIVDTPNLPSTTAQSTVIEVLKPPSTLNTEIPALSFQSKPLKSRFITEQKVTIKPYNSKKVSFQAQQITPTKYKKKSTSRGSKILIGPAPYDQNRYAQQRLQDDYFMRNNNDNRFDGFNQRPPPNNRRFTNDCNNRQHNNPSSNANRFNENAPPRFRQQDKNLQHTNYHNNQHQQHNQHHINQQQQYNQHHNNLQQQHSQHHHNPQQQHSQHHNNPQQQHNQHQNNQHQHDPHNNNRRNSQMKNNRNRNFRTFNCEESTLENTNIINEKPIETHDELKWPAINENASRRKVTNEMPYTEKKMLSDEQNIENDIDNEKPVKINDDLQTIPMENQCDSTTADNDAVLNDVQPTVENADEIINNNVSEELDVQLDVNAIEINQPEVLITEIISTITPKEKKILSLVTDDNVGGDVKEEIAVIDDSLIKVSAMPLMEMKEEEIIKSKEVVNETKPSNFDAKIKPEPKAKPIKPLGDHSAKIGTKKHEFTKKNETKNQQQSDTIKSTVSSKINKQKNQKKSVVKTVVEQQKQSTNVSKQMAEKPSVSENKGKKSTKKRSTKDKQKLEKINSIIEKDLPTLPELQKSDFEKNVSATSDDSLKMIQENDLQVVKELQSGCNKTIDDCSKCVQVETILINTREGDLVPPIEDDRKVAHDAIDDIHFADTFEVSSDSNEKVSAITKSDHCSKIAQELIKENDYAKPEATVTHKNDLVRPIEDGIKKVQESKRPQIKVNCSICNDPESSIRRKYDFHQLWEKCATKLSTKKFERKIDMDIYEDFYLDRILRRQKRELATPLPIPKSKLIQTKSNSFKKPPIVHISLSLREDVKLNECQNAWKPSHLTKSSSQSSVPSLNSTDDLYKKVRSILNRLTPEYFDNLLQQIHSLNIDTNEKLQGVILLVFEKAIDEQCYAESYAILCERLSQLVADHQDADERATFKRTLITKCQEEFHTHVLDKKIMGIKLEPYRLQYKEACAKDDVNKRAELSAIIDEEERKLRRRSVGTCKFVGELYKQKMLTSRIMFDCMKKLFNADTEQHLECLCTFLTTIGETMEKRDEDLSEPFKQMSNRIRNKQNKYSNRVRFMMQDLIDLRTSKWCNRKGLAAEFVPKTMDACERDIKMKQAREQAVISPPLPPPQSKNQQQQQSHIQIKRRDSDAKLFTNSKMTPSPMPNFVQFSQPISSNTMLGNRNQYNWSQKQPQIQQKANVSLLPAQVSSQNDNDLNAPDIVLTKIQNTIKEKLNLPQNNTNNFESITDIPKQYKCIFVRELFYISCESTAITKIQRINAGKLCANWLRIKQINVNQFIVGLKDLLDIIEDLIIDIPMVITYISELLCPILDDGILTMSDLESATKVVRKSLLADRFLSTFIDYLINELSLPIVQKMAIGQTWIRLPTIFELIQNILQNDKNLSIDDIYNYITRNYNQINEQFIRELTTIIINQSLNYSTDNFHHDYHHQNDTSTTSHCKIHINKDKLQNNLLLLEKCLDNNESLTIECLYAIQILVHINEHPQGLINELVNSFYECNVVSKEIFLEWKQTTFLPEGKGVVLKGLKSFFDYLIEPSGSDDDDN